MIDYVIIGVLGVTITLLVVLIIKDKGKGNQEINMDAWLREVAKENNETFTKINREVNQLISTSMENIKEQNGKLSKENYVELNQFKEKLQDQINNRFDVYTKTIREELDKINSKLQTDIKGNFEKTNETFLNIANRLNKIDEAQKNIEALSNNVVSLQDILSDKKSRGTFGEIQLEHILENIYGVNNKKMFECQKKLSNGFICDVLLHAPEPIGDIVIDSKFPLENFQKMCDAQSNSIDRQKFTKEFKNDVKKHIAAIKNKYIVLGETSQQAIMFLPSEAVFAEINAYHPDLITESQKTNVWITSPTTLMSLLTTIQVVCRNIERDKYAKTIQSELAKLAGDFGRYSTRWDDLVRKFNAVYKQVGEVETSSKKISNQFSKIVERVDLTDDDHVDASLEEIHLDE